MWQGLIRPFWWTALRLVSAASVARLSDESRAVLLNPWDPDPMGLTELARKSAQDIIRTFKVASNHMSPDALIESPSVH